MMPATTPSGGGELVPFTHGNLPATSLDEVRRRQEMLRRVVDWKPQPGETLVGIMCMIRSRMGAFGEGKQLLVESDDGVVYAIWLTEFVKGELRAQRGEAGDVVAITFEGKRESRSGTLYNHYTVNVTKLEPAA